MGKLVDISNQRFGRLIAIKPSNQSGTNRGKKWLCQCDCGKTKEIRSADLRFGKVTSCGCWKDEKTYQRFRKHGYSDTLLYEIWQGMKARCYRKTCKDYPNYGGRGITICDSWYVDFQNFYDWSIQNGYKNHLTIDRIDPDGNYEPNNCKWIENEKQALNRRNTKTYEYQGKNYSIRELSEKFNINYNTFRAYIGNGKTVEQIINNFK